MFLRGSGGGDVFARRCLQQSAARACERPVAVFIGTAAKADRFLPSLRVARVALCDIPTCCIMC